MNRPTLVRQEKANRRGEQGVTLVVVAVALVATLGMAALAIDLTSLYVSHEQAQRAADAAALAGAKMFVTSGFTTGQISEASACVSATGGAGTSAANLAAQVAATANLVAGTAPQVASVNCNFASSGGDQNPQITVKVQQTNLPSYFTKYWGESINSVRATAKAEAYNPSGAPGISPLQVSIKPFLVPNCVPATGQSTCVPSKFIVDPTRNNALNPSGYVGVEFDLAQAPPVGIPAHPLTPPYAAYYVVTPIKEATVCPLKTSAGACSQVGGGGLNDNIACSEEPTRLPPPTSDEGEQVGCGDTVQVDPNTGSGADLSTTSLATQCLIHANSPGPPSPPIPQDLFLPGNVSTNLPVEIDAGTNNPNQTFATAQTKNISRSDSVITVPLFDSRNPACPGGTCQPVTVIGFLQLGVKSVDAFGGIQAILMNASGCGSNIGSSTQISAGGVSSVPARLISNSGP